MASGSSLLTVHSTAYTGSIMAGHAHIVPYLRTDNNRAILYENMNTLRALVGKRVVRCYHAGGRTNGQVSYCLSSEK